MKYLKKYETLSKKVELELIDKIKTTVVEVTLDSDDDDYEKLVDCPFLTGICIIHQKEYIDSLYWDVNWNIKNLSIGDFKKIYNKLIEESIATILFLLEKNPELYSEWKDYINIDVPEYITKSDKYNL